MANKELILIELKELSVEDGREVYEMLREIGSGDGGFVNDDPGEDFGSFAQYLVKRHNDSPGMDLKVGWAPMTTYWLIVDGKPVGVGRLRHYLNDILKKLGGHIRYEIRASERGKGYGGRILKELLVRAKDMNINEVLVTCDETNERSRKVIAANGGILFAVKEGNCNWRINLDFRK